MRRNFCLERLERPWVISPPPKLFAAFAAVSLVFLANSALAQKKPKAAKKADGPSASATWTDPTEHEKSDKGPYTPRKEESDEPAAEPTTPQVDPGRKRDKIAAFGQIVIGFGKLPLEGPSFDDAPSGAGTALGLQLGGRYDISNELTGGLRIPLTTATVKQNARNQSSTAFGSPELFGEYRVALNRLTSVPIAFGVGIPLAQGDPDQTSLDLAGRAKDEVNRFADATTGWRDSELFQPKHLPIVLGVGVRHERRDWELHGDLKFVFLPALSTKVYRPEDPTPGTGSYKLNAFAMREVTTVGGSYNFLDQPLLYGGLDFSLVWTPIQTFKFNPVQDVTEPSSVQAILEPKIGARFGSVSPSVSYIAPLGGRLGKTGIGGVRLHVDAYF